jgi:hypothetical protein
MGILWRLLAPKGLKRARRTVHRAAHPVRSAGWALSPRPVKKLRRSAFKMAHPGAALELAVSDQVVKTLRGGARGRGGRKKTTLASPARAATGAHAQRLDVLWLPGTTEIPLAGASHHAAAVEETIRGVLDGGQMDAVLIPEPDNPHDPNAVAVYMLGGHVGYVPRRMAGMLQPALAALSAAHGGRHAGCPAHVALAEVAVPHITLMIDLDELGVDPSALE